jgi:hypothetical protein
LKAFAEGQVGYFTSGSIPWGDYPEYPPEYAFKVTLDQIAYDLEVIRRAAGQRILGSRAMTTALRIADKLAWEALNPVVDRVENPVEGEEKLLPHGTTVITYFDKSANIRVIPYARVALVGIPFTCAPVRHNLSGISPADVTILAQDYLAIPHEVGHYVYRHSRKVQKKILVDLYDKIKEEKRKRALCFFRWVEEIFADVYGCLIAGPWIALDFQDLQLTASKDRFVKDDREHPVPALRPYIYTRVLEKMGVQDWPERLKSHWQTRLAQRGNFTTFTLEKPKMPSGLFWDVVGALWTLLLLANVSREKALRETLSIVDTVYDDLLHNVTIVGSNTWQAAFSGVTPQNVLAAGVDNPYQELESRLRPFLASPPDFPGHELTCDEDELDVLWENWKNNLPPGVRLPRDPLDLAEMGKMIYQAVGEKQLTWVDVLHAEGWATKGPQGRED